MSDYDTIRLAYDADRGTGTLTLDRPESLNALDSTLSSEIVAGLEELESHNEDADGVALRAVILEGAGDAAFCAGADVGGFSGRSAGASSGRRMHEFVRTFPTPTIAKIDGYCLGGGFELALAADFRFASESSTFGLPEVDLGLFPGAGGVQYVTKLAGPGLAKEMAMTGEHYPPERMADSDVVHDVYPDDELDDAVDQFADTLASKPPLSLQTIKESAETATETGLAAGISHDAAMFSRLLDTEDFREGAAAFEEDREPEFHGR